jgi:hypothetical protein
MGISDDAIRERAYLIWEREGRPHGRDFEHWVRAQVELLAEATGDDADGNTSPVSARASNETVARAVKARRAARARPSRARKPA